MELERQVLENLEALLATLRAAGVTRASFGTVTLELAGEPAPLPQKQTPRPDPYTPPSFTGGLPYLVSR